MNIAVWLYQSALAHPQAPALYNGKNLHANYREFAQNACSIADWLSSTHGLVPGDRVAIFMHNSPEYLELLYGVLWFGGVVVPINHKLHEKEAAWIVENAGARIIFTEEDMVNDKAVFPENCKQIVLPDGHLPSQIRNHEANFKAPATVNRDATAWLFYTSGTTGRPKGVMLTHHNIVMMSLTYTLDVDQVFQTDCTLYAAPMSHGAGLYNFPYVRACARHVVPESRRFEPEEILNISTSMRDVVFFAAPTMVKRLVASAKQSGSDGAGIKSIIYGGGPMYAADLTEALEVFGPRFIQIYGQGESPMTITVLPRGLVADETSPDWALRRDSVGYAQACVQVRVVNDAFEDVAIGEIGEIIVCGDTVMKGYWQNDVATEQTIINGWLRTGDMGCLDADGFLTLKDRSKDVIISGGTNIYPREVEEVLALHDAVAEVSVVGAPHPEWGEQVIAFVVLKHSAQCDDNTLSAWCKSHIASFKKPSHIFFVEQLPKNNYGKIVKSELRQLLSNKEFMGSTQH